MVRRHRHRRHAALRVHRLKFEVIAPQRAEQAIVGRKRHCALSSALEQLRHVEGETHVEAPECREARVDSGIAGTPGHDDIRPRLKTRDERVRAHLPDNAHGFVDRLLRQFRQDAHRLDPAFANGAFDHGLVDLRRNGRQPVTMAVAARDFVEDIEEAFQVRLSARGPCRADHIRHAGPSARPRATTPGRGAIARP